MYPLDHKPFGWRSLWAKSELGTGLDEGLAWRYSENYRRLRGADDSGPTIGVDAASLDQDKDSRLIHCCDPLLTCPVCDEIAAINKAKGEAQLKELLDSVQQVCDEAKANHVWSHWCDWRKPCPVCDENAAIIKAKRQADTVPPPPPLQIDEA